MGEQVPIFGETDARSGGDGGAGAVGFQLTSRHLGGLRIPKTKREPGYLGIDSLFGRGVAFHEGLTVRHHVGKPAGIRVKADFRVPSGAEHLEELTAHPDIRVGWPQDNGMFLPLIVHDESVGIASCVGGLGNDSNAAVNGESSAPVRPILWLSRDVFDRLFATEVGTGRGEAEMADKLHPCRLVRLAGQAHGSRTDGFRLPRTHPQGRTFRNQIFGANIKAARARRRFRPPGVPHFSSAGSR